MESKTGKAFDYKLLTQLYFGLLPYQVLLLIINAMNGIVDSLFAGNFIGKSAMSAMGLYMPLTHFLFAVSIMLVSGSQLLAGEAMGRNNTKDVHKVFSTDIVISAIIAFMSSAALVLVAFSDVTRFIVENPLERNAVNMYILGQSLGIPALVIGQQLFAFLSLENQTKRTTIASITCIIFNIIMNYLMVGVFDLGTLGLGLGSSAGLWAFCLVMAQFYFSGKSQMKFSISLFGFKDALVIMKRGYPGAISRFVEMFRCIIVNYLVLKYVGSVGLSAFAAVNSVMGVFWPVPFGMLNVTRMIIAIILGEEDRTSLVNLNKVVVYKCFLLQCAIAAFIMLMATPFTMMFYRDVTDPVYSLTHLGFLMMPLCMPFAVISLHFCCYGQAVKKKFLSLALPVFDGVIGVVSVAFILIPVMGLKGLYYANILNGILCCLLVLGYSIWFNKHLPRSMAEFICIDPTFGAAPEARYDLCIERKTNVHDEVDNILDFCSRRAVDKKKAHFLGIAVEEMAGNVVKHGFNHDKKSHSLDVRVTQKEDNVIVTFRDNCISFDPSERVSAFEKTNPMKNLGIRLVSGLAQDFNYQNLLGMNVLTVKF